MKLWIIPLGGKGLRVKKFGKCKPLIKIKKKFIIEWFLISIKKHIDKNDRLLVIFLEDIEKKFLYSNQVIHDVYSKDIEAYNQKKLDSEIWEPQPNNLCNWCWYKNLCPDWVERKNSKLAVGELSQKLHEVRHAGGVQYGYEREIKAELIDNINQFILFVCTCPQTFHPHMPHRFR